MKPFFMLLFMFKVAYAGASDDAIALRNQALSGLGNFNPSAVISNFTETPAESHLRPNDVGGNQIFQQESSHRLAQNETANFVASQEHQRAKITANDKALEIAEGARLIDRADEVIRPGCHKEPVPCEEKSVQKTCEETRSVTPVICTRRLSVHLSGVNKHEVSRVFIKNLSKIDLTQCGKDEVFCTPKQLIQLHPECEYLKVRIALKNQEIQIEKWPTCQDPTLTLVEDNIPPIFRAKVEITEYRTENRWEGDACLADKNASCMQDASNACIEPHKIKVIDGIQVSRPCWAEEKRYHCSGDLESNCMGLLENGCSNVSAACLVKLGDYCVSASKVFQCTERICLPDKIVCPPEVIPCANGSCDRSKADESDDINEGLVRLGTLAGTATEVAENQVQSHVPAIFRGEAQECEKYILNFRDCCTDDGLLDGIIHCPAAMQVLQLAKLEHRAQYLGHYKHHLLGTTRYVYCVFPTKLSGIVQIQGRFNQLHIPFGEAEKPDCRGITPEELERIDFKALDIHELLDEFASKKQIPERAALANANEYHVKALNDKGVPYDK